MWAPSPVTVTKHVPTQLLGVWSSTWTVKLTPGAAFTVTFVGSGKRPLALAPGSMTKVNALASDEAL